MKCSCRKLKVNKEVSGNKGKVLVIVLGIIIVAALVLGGIAYRTFFGPALDLHDRENVAFYIPSGANAEQVYRQLVDSNYVKREKPLRWLMEKKNYNGDRVVPGKYTLAKDMSLNDLIDHLRYGNGEEEVVVTFTSARTLAELAGKAAKNIEADSTSLAQRLQNPEVESKYGFGPSTFLGMFLPDTYRMEWDTDADEFIERMAEEYRRFWTDDRKQKAGKLGLSQTEIATLASIVQAEQQLHPDERPIIAGLYLNRLRRGMKLQSDPTVVYALGDFGINRVLTVHLATASPYNTYLHAGLPPGPINVPSKQSIDAVLNAVDNDYLYMCAKADFSGYHAFAGGLSEHNRNARKFQQALNERKIYR